MVISGGAIGSTSPFGGENEGSNPSPRASVPDLALYGDEPARDSGDRRRSTYSSSTLPAPCRACGGPSWLEDELGAIHPCCQLHGQECPACKASETLNREQRRRGKKVIRQPLAYKGVDD